MLLFPHKTTSLNLHERPCYIQNKFTSAVITLFDPRADAMEKKRSQFTVSVCVANAFDYPRPCSASQLAERPSAISITSSGPWRPTRSIWGISPVSLVQVTTATRHHLREHKKAVKWWKWGDTRLRISIRHVETYQRWADLLVGTVKKEERSNLKAAL